MKRCIICKNDIIQFGEKHFTGFQSIFPPKEFDKACYFVMQDGSSGPYYPFAQRTEAGSFRHLRIERGFWNEQIHLRLNGFYMSYIMYDWSVAMCTYKVHNYVDMANPIISPKNMLSVHRGLTQRMTKAVYKRD